MFDTRPRIKRAVVAVGSTVVVGYTPNALVVATFALLTSLVHSRVPQLLPLMTLYQVVFGFTTLQLAASLPSGTTNFLTAVTYSVWSAASFGPGIHSILFSFGPLTISSAWSLITNARTGRHDIISSYESVRLKLAPVLRIAKASVLLFLVLLTSFWVFSVYAPVAAPANHYTSEQVHWADSVSVVVIRADKTTRTPSVPAPVKVAWQLRHAENDSEKLPVRQPRYVPSDPVIED